MFILIFITTNSQVIQGFILDKKTDLPLEFVNAGIVNKGIGTVSTDKGYFTLPISESNYADTIKFSYIGFTSSQYIVADLINQLQVNKSIYLEPALIELRQVVIRPVKLKAITLGNTYSGLTVNAGFKSDDLGSEVGTIMKVKDGKKYYLNKAGINVSSCIYDSILFRMNIYDLSTGMPGEILHTIPIYLKATKQTRHMEVDLTPYNIVVTGDFLLSLEWIQDLPDKQNAFTFCAGFFGDGLCFRQTSQDRWYRFGAVGIGIYCEAEYEK